jgi:hypothetical protein
MSFSGIAHKLAKLATENSPAIATGLAVVGTITTAYFGISATVKVMEDILVEEDARNEVMPTRERFQYVYENGLWKPYVPMVVSGVMTVGLTIAANRVGSRRAAGLAAAYGLTERAFEEYKDKVREKIGDRKEEQVRNEIAQDRLDATYLDDVKIFGLNDGQLCYDMWSDRYFKNTAEGIRAAVNELNHALIHDNYATADEFYAMLGMPSPAFAHTVGWNSDRLLEADITTILAPGDVPCLALHFKNEPTPDYQRFH